MIGSRGALLAAASLVLLAAPAPAQPPAEQRLSLLDVPFLSQSEALCGGAAAAMVMRYWGATGVTAEEFQPLVDRSRGGIETSALARAVAERGYTALPASGDARLAQRELAAGRPVIALIEDRPGTFHYVVIVGWHARIVVLHDPARTPYVLMAPADFERRWSASGNWMLSVAPVVPARTGVRPGPDPAPTGVRPGPDPDRTGVRPGPESSSTPVRPGTDPVPTGVRPGPESSSTPVRPGTDHAPNMVRPRSDPGPSAAEGCEAMVAAGVEQAQRNDLAGAERRLADAVYRCPGAAPLRELAGVRLLQRRWPEVADLASQAVAIDRGDAHAWRLLATARYVGGDQIGALEAWNHAGEPVVDLVTISGLQRTSHRAVERAVGIESRSLLTPTATGRARRRLDDLPAAALARLEYVPRAGGTAEVRAHVVERTVVPRGALAWTAIGLRAAGSREVAIGLASIGRGGERLDARWRFWPHRPAAGVALHVPGRFGVATLDLLSERQPFDDPSIATADRLSTQARLADWASGTLKWELRAGFSRWERAGSYGTLGAGGRIEQGTFRVIASLDSWLGEDRFALGTLQAAWQSKAQRRGFVLATSAAFETVTEHTPLHLFRAGDTGHARAPLLRAHPVLDEGRLRVSRLGRHLAQATAEGQHWWQAVRTVPVGAAIFVDVGRTFGRPAAGPIDDVDVGAGLRLALPGRHGGIRVDFGRGLRDGRQAFSIAWMPTF